MADKLIRTIKAVSVKNKSNGSIGFLTEEQDNTWFNINAEEKVLDEMLKETIQKGNVIEFEMENGVPKNFTLKETAKKEGSFQDDLTSFEDLLANAHKKFKRNFSITTELIENDWQNQRAIFKASVIIVGTEELEEGEEASKRTFEAYGDATQDNVGDMVKKHYIRMAETRAIARALRWATNNAKAAAEETEHGEIPEDQEDMAKE